MKNGLSGRRALLGMLVAGAGGLALGAGVASAAGDPPDKAAIEAIVRDYILAHPEIIPDAMERLRSRETAKVIAADRKGIETPFAGAWAGNPDGDVTLVMFTDYNCVYCRASAPDIDKLLAEDPKLKVVWREIPVLGPQSEVAARAALAAAKQGRYLPFHRAVFADGRPDQPHLTIAGKAAGLDAARLAGDSKGADIAREIDANIAIATRIGVSGTPAFVIGDKMLSGAVGHAALAKAIAEARKQG
jgi:protein-disulfide isomerase